MGATAVPLVLERPALTGALVTIDSIGCQPWVAQAILDRGGDFLLAVKDNQPSRHEEVRRLFDDRTATLHSRFETTNNDHGPIEVCPPLHKPRRVLADHGSVFPRRTTLPSASAPLRW